LNQIFARALGGRRAELRSNLRFRILKTIIFLVRDEGIMDREESSSDDVASTN